MTRLLLQLLLAATTATVLVPLTALPAAAESKIDFECIDEDTEDENATPYYDARFTSGPKLGPTVLAGYIPQGLTTWRDYDGPGEDLLVYTAYDEDGDTNRAAMQGVRPDGTLTNIAYIGPGHAGGVAIHGGWAYVSAPGEQVRRYDLAKLRKIFDGDADDSIIDGRPAGEVEGPASFLAVKGDTLFVGRHDEDERSRMRKYDIDPESGKISGPVGEPIRVPKKTQGLLVLEKHFVYSTSLGRNNRSNIYVVGRGFKKLDAAYEAGQLECFRAPTMSEGVTISQDRIYLAFESGASHYADSVDAPDRVIDTLHYAHRAFLPLSP